MESSRSTSLVATNVAQLAQASEGHLDAQIPTCPEWTVRDLILHLVLVYRHKTECMRRGEAPSDWPPETDTHTPPLTQLRAAMADMLAEMTARGPDSHAYTWYEPDQTVGFWIRRMVHETVIHRVDAEIAAKHPVSEIADDVALDGIDELLKIFCDWSSHQWIDELSGLLRELGSATIAVVVGDHAWTVELGPDGVDVEDTQRAKVDATIMAEPTQMLLWLWRRGEYDDVAVKGESAAVAKFYRVLETMTQ